MSNTRLRKLAENAKENFHDHVFNHSSNLTHRQIVPVALFSSACEPETIIGLIDEVEGLRKDKNRLEWMINKEAQVTLLTNGKFKITVDGRFLATDWNHMNGFDTPREAIDASMPLDCDHTWPTDKFGGVCSKCGTGAPEDE